MATRAGRRRAAWLAASLLTTTLGIAVQTCSAHAQAPDTTRQELRSFDIPPLPLAEALIHFGRQAGLQVSADTALVQAVRSPGVRGMMTREQALAALLAETGLRYRINGGMVTLDRAAAGSGGDAVQLPTIQVEGAAMAGAGGRMPAYAGGQVATGGNLGILGNRGVMDTPFNTTAYTARTIADQQSRSVADVLRNDPSVRSTWADGSYSNQFFIRGFPLANADISVNGLYGLAPYQMAGTSWVERVELLRGPSALLGGMAPLGSIGGSVNLVSRRAEEEPITRLTLGYASDSQFGGQIDISRRYGTHGEFGMRFNGAYSNGRASVDGQSAELGQAALALDYRGDRVRLYGDLIYQRNQVDNPTRPIFARAGFQIPRAPNASSNLGQSWYYAEGDDILGIVRGEFDITDSLTAYATIGARRNSFIGLYNFSYLTNAAGAFDANNYYQPSYNDSVSGEAGLRARFTTGPVRHELVVSASALYSELGVVAPIVSTYRSNLYNPGRAPLPDLVGRASTAPRTSATTLTSIAVADSLYMLDDRIQLILGGRYQNVRQRGWNATTGAQTASYDESAVTPAVALLIRPWTNVSFYANYIEGLSQGPIAPAGAANVGEVFAPIRSRQYEVGVKLDFGRLTTTLSAFQIEQPSGLLNTATNRYAVDGEIRNRGLEFNVFGEVMDGLRVLGGIALMDGEQTRTAGGINDGRKAIGIPRTQINLGVEWDTPMIPGFTLTGRVIHTSSQYASADNAQSIPAWTRFDLGARYQFERDGGQPVTIRASVENLFDRSYWAAASSNFGLARGAPRTYLLSATFDF